MTTTLTTTTAAIPTATYVHILDAFHGLLSTPAPGALREDLASLPFCRRYPSSPLNADEPVPASAG